MKEKIKIIYCSQCNFSYRISGSAECRCRNKASQSWNKNVLFCSTCEAATPIVMPIFLQDAIKCKV